MTILITADIHSGVPGKIYDCIWSIDLIRKYAEEHKIDTVIILGDLFHDRVDLNIEVLNLTYNALKKAKDCGQRWISFPGNHDMFLKNSWELNSLHILSDVMDVIEDEAKLDIGGRKFHVLPFIHSEAEYMERVNQIKESPEDILLTHIGVMGATLNECFLIKNWSLVDFSNTKFKRVFAGHFHCHQQCGKVIYPGSPIPFRFDEGLVDHGFIVYDTVTDQVGFVNSYGCKNLYEKRPPDFITLVDGDIAKNAGSLPGNNVRIVLSKEYTNNQLATIREVLQKKGAISVDWTLPRKESEEAVFEHTQITENMKSPEAIFSSWLEIDKPELQKELLMSIHEMISAEAEERFVVEEEQE